MYKAIAVFRDGGTVEEVLKASSFTEALKETSTFIAWDLLDIIQIIIVKS